MRGEVRNPITVWLLVMVTCGLYAYYWWYLVATEIKNALGRDDINPIMEIVLTVITCGLYALYLPIKYGSLIQQAQLRAGISNAEDQGLMFLLFMFLCGYGYMKVQEELNRTWQAGGGAAGAY